MRIVGAAPDSDGATKQTTATRCPLLPNPTRIRRGVLSSSTWQQKPAALGRFPSHVTGKCHTRMSGVPVTRQQKPGHGGAHKSTFSVSL